MRRRRILLLVVAVLAVAGLAVTTLPSLLLHDRPAPASLAAFVSAARQQLWSNANDAGLMVHLRFSEARCAADGTVALVFEEWRPPYLETRYAYAIRGSHPTSTDDAWGGGYGIASLEEDDELNYQLSPDWFPCL